MWNLDENWVRYDDFKFRSRNFFASIQKIHGDLGLDNMIFEFYIERVFQRYIICKILRKTENSEEDEDLHSFWCARVLPEERAQNIVWSVILASIPGGHVFEFYFFIFSGTCFDSWRKHFFEIIFSCSFPSNNSTCLIILIFIFFANFKNS